MKCRLFCSLIPILKREVTLLYIRRVITILLTIHAGEVFSSPDIYSGSMIETLRRKWDFGTLVQRPDVGSDKDFGYGKE